MMAADAWCCLMADGAMAGTKAGVIFHVTSLKYFLQNFFRTTAEIGWAYF
jgi:hypothetical protein